MRGIAAKVNPPAISYEPHAWSSLHAKRACACSAPAALWDGHGMLVAYGGRHVRGCGDPSVSLRRRQATKLRRHARLWNLAHEIVAGIDPAFARQYTAIALTKQAAALRIRSCNSYPSVYVSHPPSHPPSSSKARRILTRRTSRRSTDWRSVTLRAGASASRAG